MRKKEHKTNRERVPEAQCERPATQIVKKSCLREGLQIQLLRWRFYVKTPTGKTHARHDSNNLCHLRRTLCSHDFQTKRDSKSTCQCKPICGAGTMPRRWRTFAEQKARRSLIERREEQFPKAAAFGAFSSPILCGKAKNGHQKQSAQRATKERSMSVRRRSHHKIS